MRGLETQHLLNFRDSSPTHWNFAIFADNTNTLVALAAKTVDVVLVHQIAAVGADKALRIETFFHPRDRPRAKKFVLAIGDP